DPNWPTVGKISRAPLTNEEIERSPFGRLLPPSAARMDILPGTAGTATVPSSPIPKAPSRFRNKIPSQWTEETGARRSNHVIPSNFNLQFFSELSTFVYTMRNIGDASSFAKDSLKVTSPINCMERRLLAVHVKFAKWAPSPTEYIFRAQHYRLKGLETEVL
ncbi:hypothetical protein NECAME_09037, partial [Necator americanus]